MGNDVMFKLIERLPLNSIYQLEHFIIHLINQAKVNEIDIDLSDIGSIIASDFDEPLKEFHDYMYNVDLKLIEKIERLTIPLQNELESITDEMLETIKK